MTSKILLAARARPRHRQASPAKCEGTERRAALSSSTPSGVTCPAGHVRHPALRRSVLAGGPMKAFLPAGPGPRLRTHGNAPCAVQPAPGARPVVAVGRGSGALRVRGLRWTAPAEAPHPAPSAERLRKTPSHERDGRTIRVAGRVWKQDHANVNKVLDGLQFLPPQPILANSARRRNNCRQTQG